MLLEVTGCEKLKNKLMTNIETKTNIPNKCIHVGK